MDILLKSLSKITNKTSGSCSKFTNEGREMALWIKGKHGELSEELQHPHKKKCQRGRDRRSPRVLWSACQDEEPQVQGDTLNREGRLLPDNLGSSIRSTQWKERIYT